MSDQPPPLPTSVPQAAPFSPAQLNELAAARAAAKPIHRAVTVAKWDAWSVAIFAGLTLLFGFSRPVGLILGLGMGTIAFIEFKWLARLKKYDLNSPTMLAINQLGFAALLIGYAVYSLLSASTAAMINDVLNQAGVTDQMRNQLTDLTREIEWMIYGSLIFIAIFAQGGMALYYLTREKSLRKFVETTPAWIFQMQNAGISI